MNLASKILAGIVAVFHIVFMVVEMFFWESERIRERFQMSVEEAAHSATLAMNQGLYNGFLAAGLIWSLFIKDARQARQTQIFFFACVFAAGVFGWQTTGKETILYFQGIPALVGLVVTFLNKPSDS